MSRIGNAEKLRRCRRDYRGDADVIAPALPCTTRADRRSGSKESSGNKLDLGLSTDPTTQENFEELSSDMKAKLKDR